MSDHDDAVRQGLVPLPGPSDAQLDARAAEEAKAFVCPECGGTDFYVFYPVTDRQDVRLGRDADGNPVTVEYLGNNQIADDSSGPDEEYQCADCDWVYEIPQASPIHPDSAAAAADAFLRGDVG